MLKTNTTPPLDNISSIFYSKIKCASLAFAFIDLLSRDFLYFGITGFVLSVYTVTSVVVPILSRLPLILLSLSLLLALVILFLLLSLYSHYFLFCPFFNVIVMVSILPILIIEVEPCTIYTLNDVVTCSIGII